MLFRSIELYESEIVKVNVNTLLSKSIDTSFLGPLQCTITPNGQLFRTDVQGFLPKMMEDMYEDRKKFKKMMLQAKQEYENENANEHEDANKQISLLNGFYERYYRIAPFNVSAGSYGTIPLGTDTKSRAARNAKIQSYLLQGVLADGTLNGSLSDFFVSAIKGDNIGQVDETAHGARYFLSQPKNEKEEATLVDNFKQSITDFEDAFGTEFLLGKGFNPRLPYELFLELTIGDLMEENGTNLSQNIRRSLLGFNGGKKRSKKRS